MPIEARDRVLEKQSERKIIALRTKWVAMQREEQSWRWELMGWLSSPSSTLLSIPSLLMVLFLKPSSPVLIYFPFFFFFFFFFIKNFTYPVGFLAVFWVLFYWFFFLLSLKFGYGFLSMCLFLVVGNFHFWGL